MNKTIRNLEGKFIKGHKFISGGEKGWFKKGHCFNKSKKIIHRCEICNKEYLALSVRKRKFCSLKCMGISRSGNKSPFWKNGITLNKKEYKKEKKNEYRVRQFNAIGSHTLEEWENLKKKYGYMCLCCKEIEPIITLSRDHIIPLSKGGNNNIENIQPLCSKCNSIKNVKIINYLLSNKI